MTGFLRALHLFFIKGSSRLNAARLEILTQLEVFTSPSWRAVLSTDDASPGQPGPVTAEPVKHQPACLASDIVQDYPTAWDWRLVLAFVVAGVASLYLY